MNWLIDHRDQWDLRFVDQVGDVTDWGWLAPAQLDDRLGRVRRAARTRDPLLHRRREPRHPGGGLGRARRLRRRPLRRQPRVPAAVHRRDLPHQGADPQAPRSSTTPSTRAASATSPGRSRVGQDRQRLLDVLRRRPELAGARPRAAAARGRRSTWARRWCRTTRTYNVIVNTHSYLNGRDKRIGGSPTTAVTSPTSAVERPSSRSTGTSSMVTCGHVGQGGMTRRPRGRRQQGRERAAELPQGDHTNPVRS